MTFCLYKPSGAIVSFVENADNEPGVPDGLLIAQVEGSAKELAQGNFYFDADANQLLSRSFVSLDSQRLSFLASVETLTLSTPADAWASVNNVSINAHNSLELASSFPAEFIVSLEGKYFSNPLVVRFVDLNAIKGERLAALAEVYASKLDVWESGNLQTDDISTGRMTSWATQAVICKLTGAPFGLPYWIMNDNTHTNFANADEFLLFAQNAAGYKTQVILHNSAVKAQIKSAADFDALNQININEGWPT